MIREVVRAIDVQERLVEETSKEFNYIMEGGKGKYILARDTEGKFIWVKVGGGTTKPVKRFDTIKEAIESKLDKYTVVEYEDIDDLV